jgi:hypothetical protein
MVPTEKMRIALVDHDSLQITQLVSVQGGWPRRVAVAPGAT